MGQITAKETTDKGLISKIYKQHIQHNTRKTTHQKAGKRPKQTVLQRKYTESKQTNENMFNITHC